MKTLNCILLTSFIIIIVGCHKARDRTTTVEGLVLSQDGRPIEDARVVLRKVRGWFASNSSPYFIDTQTDKNGYYMLSTETLTRFIYAEKNGYFKQRGEPINVNNRENNFISIILTEGCKVNFELQNPKRHKFIKLTTPLESQCNSFSRFLTFEDAFQVETSCYLRAGDTVTLEYYYLDSDQVSGGIRYKDVYCPIGGEIDVVINYDF